MSIVINNQTYVGFAQLSITRVSDGVLYAFPSPQSFTINTNVTQVEQMGRTAQGQATRANVFRSGETPELMVGFAHLSPELISFTIGKELASGTFATHYPKLVTVTAATIPGDSVTGGILNGISADVDATASYKTGNISINLTRQPYATFVGTSPANDDSFAIGANGALKFSDNLVTNGDVVALKVPVSLAGVKISDVLVGQLEIQAAVIDTQNQVSIFEATNAYLNVQGKTFDFSGQGSTEISFFLNNPPGECNSWDLIASEATVQCV